MLIKKLNYDLTCIPCTPEAWGSHCPAPWVANYTVQNGCDTYQVSMVSLVNDVVQQRIRSSDSS